MCPSASARSALSRCPAPGPGPASSTQMMSAPTRRCWRADRQPVKRADHLTHPPGQGSNSARVPNPTETEAEEEVDPLLGATVGSYRILKVLGKGGMGAVYLAEHPIIGAK